MYVSKYNLVFNVNQPGRENEKILYNSLSSSVHIVNSRVSEILEDLEKKSVGSVDPMLIDFFMDNGYLYQSEEEEKKRQTDEREKYRERMNKGGLQVDLVTTYYCNLGCSYCFQDAVDMTREAKVMNVDMFEKADEVVDKLMKKEFEQPFAYYILYGGEPLLPGRKFRAIIEIIANRCRTFSTPLAIVTNGLHLSEYCDLFKDLVIGELQITVDGPAEIHNKRRKTPDGRGTYEQIMKGIEKAVEYDFPINLKIVIDQENIDSIPKLAEILDSKGWLELPDEKFKIQLAENIALFTEKKKDEKSKYMAPEEILRELFIQTKKNPSMDKLFSPFCMGVKCLYLTGAPPYPRFTKCVAIKSELAFGPDGCIYPCLAFVGFKDYSIGTYYPEEYIDEEKFQQWKNRDVETVEECEECLFKYICGGKCEPSISPEGLNMPPCPNVKEIMQIGFDYYLPKIEEKWLLKE